MGLYPSKLKDADLPSMEGKVVVITGANCGLGLAAAKQLAEKGAVLVLACRSETRALAAIKEVKEATPHASVEYLHLDLSDLESVTQFVKDINVKHTHIDVLMNNAGVVGTSTRSTTKQGLEMQIGVNHFAHFALTLRLLPLLRKASSVARIVNVSSMITYLREGVLNLDDLQSEKEYKQFVVYGQSKVANLLFTKELTKRLPQKRREGEAEVIAVAAHPGWSQTNLMRGDTYIEWFTNGFGRMVALSPTQGALSQVYAAASKNIEAGRFYGPHRYSHGYPAVASVSAKADLPEEAEKLWEISVKLTGVDL